MLVKASPAHTKCKHVHHKHGRLTVGWTAAVDTLIIFALSLSYWTQGSSFTVSLVCAALVTDAHQSTDAQKGNPPSWALHQHHHPPLLFPPPVSGWEWQNNAVFREQAVGVLPVLGELGAGAGAGPVVNADPSVMGGHRGSSRTERQTRLSVKTLRRWAAALRRWGGEWRGGGGGRREEGWRKRGREGELGTPPYNTPTSSGSLQKGANA